MAEKKPRPQISGTLGEANKHLDFAVQDLIELARFVFNEFGLTNRQKAGKQISQFVSNIGFSCRFAQRSIEAAIKERDKPTETERPGS